MALRNDLNNTRLREVETKEICQKHYTAVCYRNVEKHPSQGSCIIYSIEQDWFSDTYSVNPISMPSHMQDTSYSWNGLAHTVFTQ
jgi:hypothetical protein